MRDFLARGTRTACARSRIPIPAAERDRPRSCAGAATASARAAYDAAFYDPRFATRFALRSAAGHRHGLHVFPTKLRVRGVLRCDDGVRPPKFALTLAPCRATSRLR